MSDGDIDFVCSVCGDVGLLYARPRYCLLCTHYAVSETLAEQPETPEEFGEPEYTQRKQRGVKRIRCDNGDDEVARVKRQIEFNETKRILDKKINIGGDGLSACEYDALIRSWVNIQ